VQDVVWQLQRLVAGFAEFHGDTLSLLQGNSLFPIEVDLSRSAFQYTSASPVVQVCRMVCEIHFRAIMLEEGERGIRIVLFHILNKLHSKNYNFHYLLSLFYVSLFMLCRFNNKFLFCIYMLNEMGNFLSNMSHEVFLNHRFSDVMSFINFLRMQFC